MTTQSDLRRKVARLIDENTAPHLTAEILADGAMRELDCRHDMVPLERAVTHERLRRIAVEMLGRRFESGLMWPR